MMKKEEIKTWPNLISLIRFILIFPLAYLILNQVFIYAAILFVTMVVSDKLDGVIARRTEKTSNFGSKLDGTADTFMVTFSLISLSVIGKISPSLVLLLISFIFVSVIILSYLLLVHKKLVFINEKLGRPFMVLMFLTVLCLLLNFQYSYILVWLAIIYCMIINLHYLYVVFIYRSDTREGVIREIP